jgi:hypothetical protein
MLTLRAVCGKSASTVPCGVETESIVKPYSVYRDTQLQSKRKENIMTNLKEIITNEKIKGLIAIAAAVIMWFTPDYIDAILEAGLAAFGISKLLIKKEDK